MTMAIARSIDELKLKANKNKARTGGSDSGKIK